VPVKEKEGEEEAESQSALLMPIILMRIAASGNQDDLALPLSSNGSVAMGQFRQGRLRM
jgi:hypothetical protein